MKHYKLILLVFLGSSFGVFSQTEVDANLISAVEKTIETLTVEEPHEMDPVMVNAQMVWNDDKTQLGVIVKVKVLPGWHLYAYVPKTQPYIQTKMVLELPEGITSISEWKMPNPHPYESNIFVYKGDMVFTNYFTASQVAPDSIINAGLYYQTCDIRQCLPPQTKSFDLKL